jgi:hypothetical protein
MCCRVVMFQVFVRNNSGQRPEITLTPHHNNSLMSVQISLHLIDAITISMMRRRNHSSGKTSYFCSTLLFLHHAVAFTFCNSIFRETVTFSSILEQSTSAISAFSTTTLSREQGQAILDEDLMPHKHYSERIGLGRDAHGIHGGTLLDPSDPRLSMTYAEFPLSSLDQLMDLGLKYLTPTVIEQKGSIMCVDIGSGCGRIALYLALTRGDSDGKIWNVHGIEISDLLHQEAMKYLQSAANKKLFTFSTLEKGNSISFHLGAAEKFAGRLGQADCVFAYSTAFSAKSFSPELGALILDPEWSSLLSQSCKNGCVAITTDRALDPAYGWELVNRLDVENPEVFGTTGYVQVLRR